MSRTARGGDDVREVTETASVTAHGRDCSRQIHRRHPLRISRVDELRHILGVADRTSPGGIATQFLWRGIGSFGEGPSDAVPSHPLPSSEQCQGPGTEYSAGTSPNPTNANQSKFTSNEVRVWRPRALGWGFP